MLKEKPHSKGGSQNLSLKQDGQNSLQGFQGKGRAIYDCIKVQPCIAVRTCPHLCMLCGVVHSQLWHEQAFKGSFSSLQQPLSFTHRMPLLAI